MRTDSLPKGGKVSYLGPELSASAIAAIEAEGFTFETSPLDTAEAQLPEDTAVLVLGIGSDHPIKAALQAAAVQRDIPVVSDLRFLAAVQDQLTTPAERRVLITGSAGKTVTAAILMRLLAEGGKEAMAITASDGYLNLLGYRAEAAIFHASPSAVRDAEELSLGSSVVLNLSEESGLPVGERAQLACSTLLAATTLSVLGADDPMCQSLLMGVRRSAKGTLVPVSGGATLSDGWFAIDRTIYAVRNGRTRRVAAYAESVSLIGDHFGQDAAAAAAVASHLGVSDDAIGRGLVAFRGVAGRFDCIGTDGGIVFVDDRYASCPPSTEAAIAACPEVFWIGHRQGKLPAKVKAALRGSFFLKHPEEDGPPVDDVVTFADAETASEAAMRAAQDLVARDPGATPVLLFSPGSLGFDRQGELFRLKALSALSARKARHG